MPHGALVHGGHTLRLLDNGDLSAVYPEDSDSWLYLVRASDDISLARIRKITQVWSVALGAADLPQKKIDTLFDQVLYRDLPELELDLIPGARLSDPRVDEIDEFEITLQRLGKESVKESAADSMPLYGSAKELLEAIQAQVPESETLKEQGELYINKMRSKRVGEMDARKERERRRRKLLAEQAKAQQEREHRQREEAVFTALERQSEEENRLAKKLW